MGSYTQGNDTYACSSNGCQISCASPEFGANVCYSMQQNFLDGTSCQGGGRCNNGQCDGSSVSKEIASWISQNKTLVIALATVIGSLLIIAILSCCISRYRRRQRLLKRPVPPPPPGWGGPWVAPPAPPMEQQNFDDARTPGFSPTAGSNGGAIGKMGDGNNQNIPRQRGRLGLVSGTLNDSIFMALGPSREEELHSMIWIEAAGCIS